MACGPGIAVALVYLVLSGRLEPSALSDQSRGLPPVIYLILLALVGSVHPSADNTRT